MLIYRLLALIVLVLLAINILVSPAQSGGTTLNDKPIVTISYWQMQNCKHGYSRKHAIRGVKSVVYSVKRLSKKRVRQAKKFIKCTRTIESSQVARKVFRKGHKWRKSYEATWWIRWNRMPSNARGWTISTSSGESPRCGVPGYRKDFHKCIARQSGFLSYFQWLRPTWNAACRCRIDPEYGATWHHQAVSAWYWHLSHPRGQWPNTGE